MSRVHSYPVSTRHEAEVIKLHSLLDSANVESQAVKDERNKLREDVKALEREVAVCQLTSLKRHTRRTQTTRGFNMVDAKGGCWFVPSVNGWRHVTGDQQRVALGA